MTHRAHLLVSACLALLPGLGAAQQAPAAAAPAFASRPIIVSPITADDKKEIVLLAVSIAPGGAVPWHVHPGDCVGTVVEGTVDLLVDGQAPKRMSAGDAYNNLRGTVHGFRNAGEGQARLVNSLVVDKGAPRVQPAMPTAK